MGGAYIDDEPCLTIVETTDGLIRYGNGKQICYGTVNWSGGNTVAVSYAKVFIETPITLRTNMSDSTNTGFRMSGVSVQSRSSTSFTMYCPDIKGTLVQWLAIGKWR